MSRSTISISFKLSDDEKGFKTLAMDAASLKEIMKELVHRLGDEMYGYLSSELY